MTQPYQEHMKKYLSPEVMTAIKRRWAIERHILPSLFHLGLIGQGGRMGFKDWLLGGSAFTRVRIAAPKTQLRGMAATFTVDEFTEQGAPCQ